MKKDSEAQIAALKSLLLATKASSIVAMSQAFKQLDRVSKEKMMASGVVLTLANLSGDNIVGPVVIPDGLSAELIKLLKEAVFNASERTIQNNRIPFREKDNG